MNMVYEYHINQSSSMNSWTVRAGSENSLTQLERAP